MKTTNHSEFNLTQALARESSKYDIKLVTLDQERRDEPKLCMAVFGEANSGKTRFAVTSPDPIAVLPLTRKSMPTVVKTAREFGKRVIMPDLDLVRVDNPLSIAMMKGDCGNNNLKIPLIGSRPECCQKHYYRWHVNRVKSVLYRFVQMPEEQCRTVVIDDGTTLATDVLFANYGRDEKIMPRDRQAFDKEMWEIFNVGQSKHLVVPFESSEIYVNDVATGKHKPRGWNKVGYQTNLWLELSTNMDDPKRKLMDKEGNPLPVEFKAEIRRCSTDETLIGMMIEDRDMIGFPYLAAKVLGGEAEDWL